MFYTGNTLWFVVRMCCILHYMQDTDASTAIRQRSIAIGSGKGGVGKSTTALNLALLIGRKKLRVGLIDLDPLSNIATILGLEDALSGANTIDLEDGSLRLEDCVQRVSAWLDLILPGPKVHASRQLRALLYRRFAQELIERYDLLLLDMPAGISREENLAFLPLVASLMVVVQPEPTSHVSAGGFIRAALEICPNLPIFFWHNRFRLEASDGFRPHRVIDNYNRYVEASLKIDNRMRKRCSDLAFIPQDSALNLLEGHISLLASLQYKIQGIVRYLLELLLPIVPKKGGLDSRLTTFVRFYVSRHPSIGDVATYRTELEGYLHDLRKSGVLAVDLVPEQRSLLNALLQRIADDSLFDLIDHTLRLLNNTFETSYDNAWSNAGNRRIIVLVEGHIVRLLKSLASRDLDVDRDVGNAAAVLLFYFAMHRLLQAPDVVRLFQRYIPVKIDADGRRTRDRGRQIRYVIEGDAETHRRFVQLVGSLFPRLLTQLIELAGTYSLRGVLLRQGHSSDSAGKPVRLHREAYLKLLTTVIHDCVNSGLGVLMAIGMTPAYRAMRRGADELLQRMRLQDPPQ